MSQRICLEVVLVLCALSTVSAAEPNVIYVHPGGLEQPNPDNPSWENAYKYLQDALEEAESRIPVEIRVAQGLYLPDRSAAYPNGNGDRRAAFRLISGVNIMGGYAGPGMPDPNQRCIEVFTTVLSGDLDANDVAITDPCDWTNEPSRRENSYNVLRSAHAEPNAVLDGFTITGGNANGPWFDGHSRGAGLYNEPNSGPTVKNCTFVDNWAVGVVAEGAAIYNDVNTNPIVTACIFSQNRLFGATARGAAVCNALYSKPEIRNCIFTKNTADGATSRGAAIYNDANSTPNVLNCTFTENKATGASADGGGMYNETNSAAVVTNSIFWNDQPNEISPIGQTAAVSYCDIEDDWTDFDGNNLCIDPCFADPCIADYRLKSSKGRWDARAYVNYRRCDLDGDGFVTMKDFGGFARFWMSTGSPLLVDLDADQDVDANDLNVFAGNYLRTRNFWIDADDSNETATSPCIDAGDPNSEEWTAELWPHGKRINIGAYGGTPQAAISASPAGNAADCNNDGLVNGEDMLLLARMWLRKEVLLHEDINRDSSVNLHDLARLLEQWGWSD